MVSQIRRLGSRRLLQASSNVPSGQIIHHSDRSTSPKVFSKHPTSGRLARWFDSLHDLNFEIKYRPGKQNEIEDALSRQAWEDDFNLEKGWGEVSESP